MAGRKSEVFNSLYSLKNAALDLLGFRLKVLFQEREFGIFGLPIPDHLQHILNSSRIQFLLDHRTELRMMD